MAGDPIWKQGKRKPARKRRGRARPAEPLRHRCEICMTHPATERHHKLRRSQGGADNPENTLDLCGWCHAEVHANPQHSYREGYLIKSSAAEQGTR